MYWQSVINTVGDFGKLEFGMYSHGNVGPIVNFLILLVTGYVLFSAWQMHSLQEYLLITGFKQQSPPSNLHSKLFDMSSQKPSPMLYQFSQSEKKTFSFQFSGWFLARKFKWLTVSDVFCSDFFSCFRTSRDFHSRWKDNFRDLKFLRFCCVVNRYNCC